MVLQCQLFLLYTYSLHRTFTHTHTPTPTHIHTHTPGVPIWRYGATNGVNGKTTASMGEFLVPAPPWMAGLGAGRVLTVARAFDWRIASRVHDPAHKTVRMRNLVAIWPYSYGEARFQAIDI